VTYVRVTVYCPQAVNWTTTFIVSPLRVIAAVTNPAKKSLLLTNVSGRV